MNIGVVCDSDERLEFFCSLVKGHSVFRISPNDPGKHEELTIFDGILFDGKTLKDQPSLIGIFQSKGFLFGTPENHFPCIVRHDDNGRLHLQCGRQTAAKQRAATGKPPTGTQTLIFQQTDSSVSLETIESSSQTICQR